MLSKVLGRVWLVQGRLVALDPRQNQSSPLVVVQRAFEPFSCTFCSSQSSFVVVYRPSSPLATAIDRHPSVSDD